MIYYASKIKNSTRLKKRARNKVGKVSYGRTSTSSVQPKEKTTEEKTNETKVEEVKAKETKIEKPAKEKQEKPVLSTEEQIENLDKEFSENKISKKEYLKKRAKLERNLD